MFENSKGKGLFQQLFTAKDVSKSYQQVGHEHPWYPMINKVNICFKKIMSIDHEIPQIKSHDGLILKAFYIDNNSNKTYIGIHDYCNDGVKELSGEGLYFYEKGYNVLIPFMRGHCISEGNYISFSKLEADDLNKWVEYANKKHSNTEVVLQGIGMGANVSIIETSHSDNISKLIIDSPYLSIDKMIDDWIELLFQSSKKKDKIKETIRDEYISKFGFDYLDYEPTKVIDDIKIPILLVNSELDSNLSSQNLKEINPKIQSVLIDQASRNSSFYTNDDEYIGCLNDFLGQKE